MKYYKTEQNESAPIFANQENEIPNESKDSSKCALLESFFFGTLEANEESIEK